MEDPDDLRRPAVLASHTGVIRSRLSQEGIWSSLTELRAGGTDWGIDCHSFPE